MNSILHAQAGERVWLTPAMGDSTEASGFHGFPDAPTGFVGRVDEVEYARRG